MANLLDQFVLELRLDSTQFTDSQRQAADALRQVEGQATRSAGSIEKSGQGVVTFFRGIEAPLATLRRQFEGLAVSTARPQRNLADLASQGARTGESVERGALAGASGLRVLGIAGLGAFAAITAVEKTMSALSATAARTFGVSVGAATAGLPIERFSAISQALGAAGNVPEEQTQAALADIGSLIAGLKVAPGIYSPMVSARQTALVQAGVQDANMFQDTTEETFDKIRRTIHAAKTDADAIAIGRAAFGTGSETLSIALHNLTDEQYKQAIAARNQTEISKEAKDASAELGKAETRLGQAWEKLGNVLLVQLEPGLEHLIDITITLVTWLGKLSGIKLPAWMGPVADYANRAAGAGGYGTGYGSGSSSTGTSPSSGGTAPSGDRVSQAMQFFEGKGLSHEQAAGVVARLNAESGLDPNRVNPTSGALGIAQWLGGRKPAAEATGGDFQKQLDLVWSEFQGSEAAAFARIKAAGPAADAARAMEGYERAGNPAFTEGAAQSATALAAKGASTGSNQKNFTAPSTTPDYFSTGGRTTYTIPKTDADVFSGGTFMKTSALIDAAQQGQTQSVSSSSTVNHGDNNIGDVTIHTQATDGPGVVAAFNDEITRRNSQASQANTGLT